MIEDGSHLSDRGLATGVIAIALVIVLLPRSSEPRIRITGLILQLLGIGTVVCRIRETHKEFGFRPVKGKVKDWLRRFPLFRRNVVIGVGGVSFSAAVGKGRGFVAAGAGEYPTIEARIAALERNIGLINDRISNTQHEMDQEFQKPRKSLKERKSKARKTEDAGISKKLETASTGGIHISADLAMRSLPAW